MKISDVMMDRLAGYLWGLFKTARKHRETHIDPEIFEAMRNFKSEYSSEKLAQIREIGGSETFLPLTNIKCRACSAWLSDLILSDKCWSIETSPKPEDNNTLVKELSARLSSEYEHLIRDSGDVEFALDMLHTIAPEVKKDIEFEIKQTRKEQLEELETMIDDYLTEGKFYKALKECIQDISIYPTVFLRGPVYKVVYRLEKTENGVTQAKRIIQEYNRCNPLDIFPDPDASSIDTGYIFYRSSISLSELSSYRDIDGYNPDAINDVIEGFSRGEITHDWTASDYIRRQLEEKPILPSEPVSTVDTLEFWGSIRGSLLKEWGVKGIDDDNKYYNVACWMVGDRVIKAMLNPHPLGKKPFSAASFISIPGSIWGISLAKVLSNLQESANALTRAAINNSAFASGPLVERNLERLSYADRADKRIIPWKVIDVNDMAMSDSPAVRYYQPAYIADRIANVLSYFLKLADELSGIPSYSHGDITVGGAGRTASGLSMLTGNATRGIKAVVSNIDEGIIKPTVLRQFEHILLTSPESIEVPDIVIIPKGTASIIEREQINIRTNEFLNITNNPVDVNILGLENRRRLLFDVAKRYGIELDPVPNNEPMPIPSMNDKAVNINPQGGLADEFRRETGRPNL